jgi:hypothetical protein
MVWRRRAAPFKIAARSTILTPYRPYMAKPRNTKIMIYVAHTESTKTLPRKGDACGTRLTGPNAQLKSCMDQHPLTHAGSRSRSLAFGPAIVRMSRSDVHLCTAGETAVRHVNRLWYGRALVALRTYPQWTLRAAAIQALQQRLQGMEGGDDCAITLGNPVQ